MPKNVFIIVCFCLLSFIIFIFCLGFWLFFIKKKLKTSPTLLGGFVSSGRP